MTAHLLLFTLGPVQDFIAQARRTRDLWHGSHLLSELSRAAARALIAGNARLVFPALEADDPELQHCAGPLRPSGDALLSVANKLLAEVPAGVDPEALAREARQAVLDFWRDTLAAPVRLRCAGLLPRDIEAAWNEQIDTLTEINAAWAPVAADSTYREARRSVEAAIAARKSLRDFAPWQHLRGRVPKSSLDGARETVLLPPRQRQAKLAHKYRITSGEQLDAVGLVKRAGGEPGQFVPVVNIALASWLAMAEHAEPARLESLRTACKDIGISRITRNVPCAEPFRFDASIFMPGRWASVFDEQGLRDASDAEAWGEKHVRPLLEALHEPSPYVACLVADGDGMGSAINAMSSVDGHRTLSQRLATFAAEARTIVEEHRGSLVYAGGDDVLAFVPVAEALGCADSLRRRFARILADACASTPEAGKPTLSVGLGIGHCMEGMGDLLELGRAAEVAAKGARLRASGRDRNALAILVDKRSGGRRTWRARWDEWGDDPVARLRADIDVLAHGLSIGKIYEIQRTLQRLPKPTDALSESWARLLTLEVRRSLARNESGEGTLDAAQVGLDLAGSYPRIHATVAAWVSRMLIAQTFAAATPRPPARAEEDAA